MNLPIAGAQPIIIFGAALRPDGCPTPALLGRIRSALAYGATRNVFYIVTGGVPRNGRTEASVMAELLIQAGLPPQRIIQETRASDTFDSIVACSHILKQSGVGGVTPVAVVTSPYHAPRCLLLLRLAGWHAHMVPFIPMPHYAATLRTRLRHFTHEILAIPWDALLVLLWRIVPR